MKIPQAQENLVNIAPQVEGIRPIGPVAAEDDSAKAGMELKNSLQNAMDGFVKLYAADQRADAIKNFNSYKMALEEYRDSADIDPQTGRPIGFTKLVGDQVTEDALNQSQLKVQAARKKLNDSLRGFLPDLQDEFGMRADELQASFDTATNAHFLKSKYEKAKNAAQLDNRNIETGTLIGQKNDAALAQAKAQMKKNYMSYLQSEKEAELLSQQGVENIIKNNVILMKRDGDPKSYDEIRGMLGFYQKKGYLSKVSEDALLHDIDLESASWKYEQPDTTEEGMASYLRTTKNLSAEEKSRFIQKAHDRDSRNERAGNSKKVSAVSSLLDWVTTRQANDFSNANEYDFNIEIAPGKFEEIKELEGSKFRSDFLSFANMIFSSVNETNQGKLQQKGLAGVLTEEQIRMYNDPTNPAYKGRMMKKAYARMDEMFKKGELSGLTKTEISEIKTKINNIREGNTDFAARQDQYRALTEQAGELIKKPIADLTVQDIDQGVFLYNQLMQFKGSDVAKNGDKNYSDLERHLGKMLAEQIKVKNVDRNSRIGKIKNFFPKMWKKAENVVFSVDDWFKTGENYNTSNRHHKMISDYASVAYADGKRVDGSYSPLPLMYKEALDMLWEDEEGKGLTLVKINSDGSLDVNGPKEIKRIAFNNTINPDGSISNIERDFVKVQAQFASYLNNKYKTQIYTDFNKIDARKLSPEERQVLIELTRREMLKGSGNDGYTYLPVNPVPAISKDLPSMLGWSEMPVDWEYERQLANIPPIGSFNGDLTSIEPSAFEGGSASSEDIVKLVSEGYTSFEDYCYMADKNRPEQYFSPQEHLNLILNAVTPYGLNTITTPEQSYLQRFSWDLATRLSKENPTLRPEDFLKPDTFGYNVSNETYEWAVKEYDTVRKKQLVDLRNSYMRGESLERMKKY